MAQNRDAGFGVASFGNLCPYDMANAAQAHLAAEQVVADTGAFRRLDSFRYDDKREIAAAFAQGFDMRSKQYALHRAP